MTFPARINGKCANGDRITVGDPIAKSPKGWAHADCAATADFHEREAERANAAAYTEYVEDYLPRQAELHALDGDPIAQALYARYSSLAYADTDGHLARVRRTTFAGYDRARQMSFAEVAYADLDRLTAEAERSLAFETAQPATMDYMNDWLASGERIKNLRDLIAAYGALRAEGLQPAGHYLPNGTGA